MFKIEVKNDHLYTIDRQHLITDDGTDQKVEFIFSPEWDGLVKEVVFKSADGKIIPRSVILDDKNQCVIPPDLLKPSDTDLLVGIYGAREPQVIITNYVSLGKVLDGTVML